MTDRKQFEAWANTVKMGELSPTSQAYAWAAWQAAIATAPAWHPAPTVPGLWISAAGYSYMVTDEMLESQSPGRRWFGPIPQENK